MATALSDVYGSVYALGGVPESYRPSANEEFMNPDQLAYFRAKLLGWKDEILRESQGTMASLKSGPIRAAAYSFTAHVGLSSNGTEVAPTAIWRAF